MPPALPRRAVVGGCPSGAGLSGIALLHLHISRDRRAWCASPRQLPNAALPQILNEIWPKCDKARPASPPRRRVYDAVAAGFGAEPTGEALPRRIPDCRIAMQRRLRSAVGAAQIVKGTEKVGDQFGVVGRVLEAANRFELARQVVRHFGERGLGVEPAIPGAAVLAVEAIAAWAGMREGGGDE